MTGFSHSVVHADALPEVDVFSDAYATDPRTILDRARKESPLVRTQRGVEAIAYPHCQAVYRDDRLAVGQRELFEKGGLGGTRFASTFVRNLNNSEGEDHARLRAVVGPSFTPQSVERLRATTRDLIESWLDEAGEQEEFDFMDTVADRLPAAVFCLILGAPVEDAARVGRLSYSMTKMFLADPASRDEILTTFGELEDYAGELLERRRQEPADDVLSALVAGEREGQLTSTDSVTMVLLMLTGSTDTTASQLAHVMIALALHPDQYATLRAQPEPMTPKVMELARFAPGVWATARTAYEPIEFQGVAIEAGTQIWSNVVAANSDPEAFTDPRRLDLEARRRNPPLNWGLGVHFCLGRFLATLELEEVLRAITRRWAEFELVGEPRLEGIPTLVSPRGVRLRYRAAA